MPDYARMLVLTPKCSMASTMSYLKGKSSLAIFDRRANPKHEFGDRRRPTSRWTSRAPRSKGTFKRKRRSLGCRLGRPATGQMQSRLNEVRAGA